ncbi:Nucleoside-diphosphate-sugar epimerase [Prevotellaceae bacterium HUN156]|nr:Nucleoside-diphosphate-sugar epimerase [Prevotellaceae bacterium HUN156]
MNNNCIITGATGYIGSHVLKYLLSKGWDIHVIADPKFGYANIEDVLTQIDVFEYEGNIISLCEYFQKVRPDVVFHLAAAVITNYRPEQIPVLIRSNIQFGTEILEAMKSSETKLLVSTGSYWQNYNSDTYNPVDLYAATKEAFEKIIQFYVDAYGFRHINLRLFDVYGEDDRRPKLWNLLKKIAGTEEEIDVSPGEQFLDMVHVKDVCTAYEKAYELLFHNKNIVNKVYGVRTGRFYMLKDLISLYKQKLNKNVHVNIGAKKYKDREVMKPYSGYDYLPNWESKVDIDEGLTLIAKS